MFDLLLGFIFGSCLGFLFGAIYTIKHAPEPEACSTRCKKKECGS